MDPPLHWAATSAVPQAGTAGRAARRRGDCRRTTGPTGSLDLPDRVLLVAVYWRTNLTMRQIGPLFGVSHSAAHRVIDTLGPLLALASTRRRPSDQIAIVDGTLIPTRDHTLAAPSKNYRYSANLQVAIDANTCLVIASGDPQPGNRNDTVAYRTSGIARTLAGRPVIADGGYRGNPDVVIPYRKPEDGFALAAWKEDLNAVHRTVRARIEHVLARMKVWKILRDNRRAARTLIVTASGIARLHNIALAC